MKDRIVVIMGHRHGQGIKAKAGRQTGGALRTAQQALRTFIPSREADLH